MDALREACGASLRDCSISICSVLAAMMAIPGGESRYAQGISVLASWYELAVSHDFLDYWNIAKRDHSEYAKFFQDAEAAYEERTRPAA